MVQVIPENVYSKQLWHIGQFLPRYTAQHPKLFYWSRNNPLFPESKVPWLFLLKYNTESCFTSRVNVSPLNPICLTSHLCLGLSSDHSKSLFYVKNHRSRMLTVTRSGSHSLVCELTEDEVETEVERLYCLAQCFSNCGPRRIAGLCPKGFETNLQESYQTLNELNIRLYYMSVLKLPLLVDLQHKLSESVPCPTIIILQNDLNCHHHVAVKELGHFVDPFRSHTSRSLFSVLPWFLLPFGV
jgi:hypothetical protein